MFELSITHLIGDVKFSVVCMCVYIHTCIGCSEEAQNWGFNSEISSFYCDLFKVMRLEESPSIMSVKRKVNESFIYHTFNYLKS